MKSARTYSLALLGAMLPTLVGCGGSAQSVSDPQPQQQPDFALTVSQSTLFVPVGAGKSSIQVSVQPTSGFNQPVSVSLSGLPVGVDTSPVSPMSVNPGTNQTITLTAASGTPTGVQDVTVQATAGTLNHTASFSMSVANPSYAYLATGYPNQPPYDLVGFSVDANTGALSAVAGSPLSLTNMPIDGAVASETGGAFVFALIPDSASQTVALQSYSVNTANGALTPLQTINYPPQTSQTTLAVSPSQKFLYVVEQDCIVAYAIDPASGILTQSSCFPPQVSSGLAIAPPGNFAYQLTPSPYGPATIYLFSVDQNDGSMALIQSYNVNQGGAMYTDPQGRALYEVVPVFDIDTCSQVVIWQIDPATGTLTNLNTSFSPLCEVFSLVFNPTDAFAYVTSGGGEGHGPNGIYAATANATTGNLTSISGSPFASGTKASFGAVEPARGKFLVEYAGGGTLGDDGKVLVYAIEPNSGALSQVTGAQATLPSPYWYVAKMLVVSPNP